MKSLKVTQRCRKGCEFDGRVVEHFDIMVGIGFYDTDPGIHIGDAFKRKDLGTHCPKCGSQITYVVYAVDVSETLNDQV